MIGLPLRTIKDLLDSLGGSPYNEFFYSLPLDSLATCLTFKGETFNLALIDIANTRLLDTLCLGVGKVSYHYSSNIPELRSDHNPYAHIRIHVITPTGTKEKRTFYITPSLKLCEGLHPPVNQ